MIIGVINAILVVFIAGGVNPCTRSLPTKQFIFFDCAGGGKNTRDIIVRQHTMKKGIAVHLLLKFGSLVTEKGVTTMNIPTSFTIANRWIKHLIKTFLSCTLTNNTRRTILCGEKTGFILHQKEMGVYLVSQQTSQRNRENQKDSFGNHGPLSIPARRSFADGFKGDFFGVRREDVRGQGGRFFVGEFVEYCFQLEFLGHEVGNVVWDWVRIEVVFAHDDGGVEL
jgi:hypothetical protein